MSISGRPAAIVDGGLDGRANAVVVFVRARRPEATTVMPVIMTGMMLFLPSGLVLYIIVNTILGIFQQQWTQKLNASAA